jgi:cell wall assembly regulator SMI1
MMGMPTPYVEPSLWYRRTWTGRPVAAGEPDGDGVAAEPDAEADAPARQVPVGEGEDPPHAADNTSATPSAASGGVNRNKCRRLMTLTMLLAQPARHPTRSDPGPGHRRPVGHSGPVPNLDFYAVGSDHTAVLDAVFGLGVFRVFEEYSGPDEELREFTAAEEVPAARVQRFLMLYVVGSGPEPVARRIDLRPGNILGDATFRYQCEGWGLIQLDLGSVVDDGSELRRSHTNHNTEKRARKWSEVAPDAGDPGQWDWTLITRTSSKLNRLIRGMAARKIGPWPVLPQAARLIADAGLRYVYGLGVHTTPSPGIRGEVTRLAVEAVRAPGKSFPGGADDAEIADLQQAVGIPLPADLVDWLRVCKGDLTGPGGLYGVRHSANVTDIASALDWFPSWREHGWLPVAGDGNGDHYVLVTNGELTGCVGFVDQADTDAINYIVATNLWTFLWFLLRDEAGHHRWPFNRNHVVGHDPAMATIAADLQPWRDEAGFATTT